MASLTETKPKISAAETQRRREALRQADAHNRLEGQFPTPESTAIFGAFIRGEIDRDQILPRLNALHLQSCPLPGYALQEGVTLKNKLGVTAPEKLEAAETD